MTHPDESPNIIKSFYPCIVGVGVIINQTLTIPSALAQITTDHTVGTEVEHITKDGILTITGGEQRGKNLFHSFEQFSVPNGTTVNFQNSLTINNIINRVTGSSLSNIEGTITVNGTANFILGDFHT